jgi:hypothetical protein
MEFWKVFKPDTVFDFGKYKGRTVDEVARINAPYILWCARIVDKFLMEESELLAYQRKYEQSIDTICCYNDGEVERSYNFYLVTDEDLHQLREKWENYQNDMEDERDDYPSVRNNPYYNDNLDMDQQDPDFWDSF